MKVVSFLSLADVVLENIGEHQPVALAIADLDLASDDVEVGLDHDEMGSLGDDLASRDGLEILRRHQLLVFVRDSAHSLWDSH